jgi:hypothetical protein
MRTILRAMLGVAIAVSPLLAGQEPTPGKEKQKQDEPRKQPPPNPPEGKAFNLCLRETLDLNWFIQLAGECE